MKRRSNPIRKTKANSPYAKYGKVPYKYSWQRKANNKKGEE